MSQTVEEIQTANIWTEKVKVMWDKGAVISDGNFDIFYGPDPENGPEFKKLTVAFFIGFGRNGREIAKEDSYAHSVALDKFFDNPETFKEVK